MNENQRYHMAILLLACLAIGHQILQKGFDIFLPLAHCYLDDVLAMPLLLAVWRWERRWWWQIPILRKRDILLFTLFLFFLFEIVLPQYSTAYTADWWDGLAYLVGAILFWWWQPE